MDARYRQTEVLSYSGLTHWFFNAAAGTSEGLTAGISPAGQDQTGKLGYFLFWLRLRLMKQAPKTTAPFMLFGIFGTAVFAQPSVAEIKEVIGLVHYKISNQ